VARWTCPRSISSERTVNVVKVFSPDDVDEQLRDWLTEAYDHASG
jgi:hypothetical protein